MFRSYQTILRELSCLVVKLLSASRTTPSAPYTRPTQQFSRPPPIQKLGAENHMLQLNI